MALRVLAALGASAILSGCVIDQYYDEPVREQPRAQQQQSRYPDQHYQTYRPQPQPAVAQPGRPPVDHGSTQQYRPQPLPDYHPRPIEREVQPPRHSDDGPRQPQPSTGHASRDQGNSASNTLLQQAAKARAQGDYARAQALAERAQSIAPQDAENYAELARIYRAQGDVNRARQMARRGLSVGSTNPHTLRELEQMSR